MKHFALLAPATVTLVLGLVGCGDDLTIPAPTPTSLSLAVIQGDSQTGTVGQALPSPLVVVVRTETGAPMAGSKVVFVETASGTGDAFDPDTALTDGQGQALTHWVLGTTAGPYSAEARLVSESGSGAQPVPIRAAAVAAAPDSLRADGPAMQGGRRGQTLDEPLVVAVVDRYGNPVGGVEVKWKVEEGNGELSPDEDTVTGADGRSTVTWTLGNRVGVQQAIAEVKDVIGSPVSFTATVSF
jgi:Big-like domain-containing protein